MPELYRLNCEHQKTGLTLILTDEHVILDPSPEFRALIADEFAQAKRETEEVPGFVKWIVDKAMTWAGGLVEKVFQPYPIHEVDLLIVGDTLKLTVGHINLVLDEMKVDPVEAFAFDFKLQEARGVLKHK